jgi:hypothetical protein
MTMNAAYVAGLIDGEGCIHLDVTRGLYYRARVTVGMTEPALFLLQELQQEWGGTLYQFRKSTQRWAAAWTWHLTGEPAAAVLREIQPYLRLKCEQAQLAIELEEIRLALPLRWGNQRLWSDEARTACGVVKDRLHALNQKGPRAPAVPVEVV